MNTRRLTILGTASQAPTRDRNHNGYYLRWDRHGVLFDPGESTQRQMVHARVKSSTISHIFITHGHGDHCLGLPGVLQRMAIDQRTEPVTLVHPAAATETIDHLLALGLSDSPIIVDRRALPTDSVSRIPLDNETTVVAYPLSHRVPTLGYRLEESDSTRLDRESLTRLGLEGAIIGDLIENRHVVHNGTTVTFDDVSIPRPGMTFAFIMDTRLCPGVHELCRDADLVLSEATYLESEAALAQKYAHMTAAQIGKAAASGNVQRLVLSHFSARYSSLSAFVAEAGQFHTDVVTAVDFDVFEVPRPR